MNLDGKRVLVTGGAGFIGSTVVDQLAGRVELVRVVDDLSAGRRDNLQTAESNGNVEYIEADILDCDAMRSACERIDVVMHLAVRCLRLSLVYPWGAHEVNSGGTLRVLEAAHAAGVERFLYCSSSEVYGTALYAPMDEAHPTQPTTVYGASKLAGETYALAFWRTHGMPVVVARPFNTFGYRGHHEGARGELIPKMVVRALNRQPPIIFGDGSQTRDFTFVTDTARGIVSAVEADELVGETVNIGFGREISVREIAETVCALYAPGLEPQSDVARPGDVRRHLADTTKARRVLGFEAGIGFEQGLELYVAWLRERYPEPSALLGEEVERNWLAPAARG
jgi:UDP-glucose 4-epimerase